MSDETERAAGDAVPLEQLTLAPSPWQDVTQLFASAAKELKVGQMVHSQDFNLFDSMSALELMDPKMDSGVLVNGAPPQSISARLASGAVLLEFASARDVLATIDELFRLEAAWINGQPLQQTLLTSVYMHRDPINALVGLFVGFEDLLARADLRTVLAHKLSAKSACETLQLVMAAICLVVLKTAIVVRDAVVRGDIYEEEDFSPANGFDIGILEAFSSDNVLALLSAAEQRLEAVLAEQQQRAAASKKASKKKPNKKAAGDSSSSTTRASSSSYEPLHTNARVGSLICEALLRRVRLRRMLFEAFTGLGTVEAPVDLDRARAQFAQIKDVLGGLMTEQLEMDPECFSGKAFGVDKTISRLLLSGSPPRETKIPSLDDAVAIQRLLMDQLVTACSAAEWASMEELRIFLADFSREQPNIIARSYVLLFLYMDKKIYGKYSFTEWLSAAMVANGVPSVLLSTQEGVVFSSRVIETLYESSLKLYLFNRSRQRARIEYLLEEWAILQLEAASIDDKFTTEMAIPKVTYPRYFTAWTLEETVLLMIHYVLLGIELELYAPSELGTIYWYLDYLHGSRLQNLNVTWQFVEKMKRAMPTARSRPGAAQSAAAPQSAADASAADAAAGDSKSKKPKSKSKPAASASASAASGTSGAAPSGDFDPAKARFLREINYNEMQRSVMRAYFQLFSALERDGLVPHVTPTYSSTRIRFAHRFAAFKGIHFPAPLSHDDYTKNSDFSPYDVALIYKSADECFKVARAHGEELLRSDAINGAGGVAAAASSAASGKQRVVHGTEVECVMKAAIASSVALMRREQSSSSTGAAGVTSRSKKTPGAVAVHRNGSAAADAATTVKPSELLDFSVHAHFPVVAFPAPKA